MSGRGKSASSMALIEAAREILAEIAPCSVRAVAYQLFNRKLIPDMSKASTARVSEQLVWARENGHIDWADITDETRETESVPQWSDPDSIMQASVNQYRRDNWQDQPNRVTVISEKGTVAGTIRPVLQAYGVDLITMHGFGSATALNNLADLSHGDKPLILLYVGDFDPSGMSMSEVDLVKRLAKYGCGSVLIRRVALDKDDLADLGAMCFSVHDKRTDSRYRWFTENHGEVCAELDALSPAVLRDRLIDAIEKHMDLDAWDHSKGIEAAEQQSMHSFFDSWKARGKVNPDQSGNTAKGSA